MGVESYLLRLKSDSEVADVESNLLRLPNVSVDESQWPCSLCEKHFVYRDGKHVIEFELHRYNNYTTLSMRFSICHPESVDSIFINLAAVLMQSQNLIATICEVRPDDAQSEYSLFEIAAFTAASTWSIDKAREQWQKQFGPERLGISAKDACKHFYFDMLL